MGSLISTTQLSLPQAGQKVIVRNRPALVRSVIPHAHLSLPALHEVQVDYLDNWSQPDSDSVIWEVERGTRVYHRLAMLCIDDSEQMPDAPGLLQAFLHANQWSAVNRLSAHEATEASDLQLISPWQSAVQVEDYQLFPVLKALKVCLLRNGCLNPSQKNISLLEDFAPLELACILERGMLGL